MGASNILGFAIIANITMIIRTTSISNNVKPLFDLMPCGRVGFIVSSLIDGGWF
jgi:hypothetical protein